MLVKVVKSNRKTVEIQVNPDLSLTVRAPKRASQRDIEKFLKEKEGWILKTIEKIKKKQAEYEASDSEKLTNEEIRELAKKALEYIPQRTAYFAKIMGVTYNQITIRNQKTRWGSCSSRGNLNFNCLLMLTPPDVIDYVIVHELCHRKELNHSKAFWDEVKKVLPDYREPLDWLKKEGNNIIQRMST